jgi:predicted nucleotidyltransferase
VITCRLLVADPEGEKDMKRLEAALSIQKLTDQIVNNYHPEKIILFGSAAGNSENINDIDLFIVKDDVPHIGAERIQQVYRMIVSDVPVDYLIYRPSEVAERLSLGDPFVTCILKEGTVLYG